MLTAWNIYQSLEYRGEQDQLKLNDFFLALIANHELISSKQKVLNNSASPSESSMNLNDDQHEIASNKSIKMMQIFFNF
jgi:hypothetical protein